MQQMEMVLVTEPDEFLRSVEVAMMLGVTVNTIGRWLKEGYFPNAYRINPRSRSHWRIPKKDVDAFIEERTRRRGYFYIPTKSPDTKAE